MYELPQSIVIDDTEYKIRNNGDYRMVLDCLIALEDESLTSRERIFASLIIFYEDLNSINDIQIFGDEEHVKTAVTEMYKFFNCGQSESPGAKVNYKLIDWEQDSQLISSAINKVANTEIRAVPYIHWWTFMGYYLAVGESALSHVVSIRNKIMKGTKLEKHEKQFRKDNPQYFVWKNKTVSQKESEELARQLWNSGK